MTVAILVFSNIYTAINTVHSNTMLIFVFYLSLLGNIFSHKEYRNIAYTEIKGENKPMT